MPVLNFKPEFAKAVRSGEKRQTIRRIRVNPILAGEALHLWAKQRQPNSEKLRQTVCAGELPIELFDWGIILDGINCEWEEPMAEYIAHLDGFESAEAMRQFFEPQFPFRGQLIYW